MKKVGSLLFILFLAGCTQEPARITYNDKKLYTKNNYVNYNYNKGSYKTLSDGRVVRDITLKNEDDISTTTKTSVKDEDNDLVEKNDGNKNTYDSCDYVVVKPEDSLYRISKNNNIELNELARINGISAPYNIIVGQKIKIPKNSNGNSAKTTDTNIKQNNDNYHIVKQGETLYSISKAYNIDMDQIIKVNNLEKPYNLSLGQKLLLKSNSSNEIKVVKEDNKTPTQVEKVPVKTETAEFIWPVKGEIIKKFGEKINDTYFDGISIKSQKGTAIKASKSGEVAYSGNELKGYGNIIILRHENNWLTIYAHCDELRVKQGEKVSQGDIIATIGDTGNVNSSQLYFSVREGREAKDPLKFLK